MPWLIFSSQTAKLFSHYFTLLNIIVFVTLTFIIMYMYYVNVCNLNFKIQIFNCEINIHINTNAILCFMYKEQDIFINYFGRYSMHNFFFLLSERLIILVYLDTPNYCSGFFSKSRKSRQYWIRYLYFTILYTALCWQLGVVFLCILRQR